MNTENTTATSQVNHAGDSTPSSTTDSAPALALVSGSAPTSSPQQRCGSDNFPLTRTPSIQVSSISDSVFLRTMLMIESALDCDICSGMMVLGSDRMALARSLILLWREHGRPEQASWLDRPDVLELGDLRSLFPFRDISWSDFNDIIFGRTSQVNHAGDSTKQTPKHDTGVGSGVWFGRFILREETALRTSRDCFRRRVQYQRGRPTHFLRLEARRLQQFWFDVRTETVIAAKCLVPALGILGFRLCLVKLLRAVKRVLSFCSWVSSFFRRTSKVSHG